jgi:curli biogenesis system outer membrane secretion channel CsgG
MKTLLVLTAIAALAGCGVDTATSAATAASIKKQELEQGQKTMQQAQQKIDAAMQQLQQRAGSSDPER